jgi:hypothetical protein
MDNTISLIALGLVAATSITLFLTTEWRLSILTLAAQYIGVFLLVMISWPLSMSVVKLVSGWMSGAILGMAMISISTAHQEENHKASEAILISRPFYLLATSLVWMLVISQANIALDWFPDIRLEQSMGGLLLIGMGLLKLSFNTHPLHASIGLLTALSGFEIIYASLVVSTLMAGLLAGITLGLALAGSYLLMAPNLEEI